MITVTEFSLLMKTVPFGYIYDSSDEEHFAFEYVGSHQFLINRGRQQFQTKGEYKAYFQQVSQDIALADKAAKLDYLFCENAEDYSVLYYGSLNFLLERGEWVCQTKDELDRYLDSVKQEITTLCNR